MFFCRLLPEFVTLLLVLVVYDACVNVSLVRGRTVLFWIVSKMSKRR